MSDPLVIEHGSSAPGRWLRERRTRIVLWIAVAEGLVVWIAKGAHITTILGLTLAAVLAVFAYGYVSSRSRSELLRQLLWIVAASQILADIVVIGASLLFVFFVVLIVIFAVVALGFLFLDRR